MARPVCISTPLAPRHSGRAFGDDTLMEELGAIMLISADARAGIAGVLSTPIVYFGRRRVCWRLWELLVLVLPFAFWSVLMFSVFSGHRQKRAFRTLGSRSTSRLPSRLLPWGV